MTPNNTPTQVMDKRQEILQQHYAKYGEPRIRKGSIDKKTGKRKADRWQTYLPIPTGKRDKKEILKTDIKDLEDCIINYYVDIKDGVIISNNPTYEAVFNAWYEYKKDEYAVSRGTLKKYREIFQRFFCAGKYNKQDAIIKNKPIREITQQNIEVFLNTCFKTQEIYRRTFYNLLSDIKGVFEFAWQQNIIDENPVLRIDTKRYIQKLAVKPEIEKRGEIISSEDKKKLIQYCNQFASENPTDVRPYLLKFYVYTGCRASEPPAIMWNSIFLDDSNPYFTIEHSLKETENGWELKNTKNGKVRNIPITPALREIIETVKQIQEKKYNGELSSFLFGKTKTDFYNTKQIECYLGRICKKIGVNISITKLRKTLNTNMAKKGVPSYRRSAILGNTEQTNNQYYTINDNINVYSIDEKMVDIMIDE